MIDLSSGIIEATRRYFKWCVGIFFINGIGTAIERRLLNYFKTDMSRRKSQMKLLSPDFSIKLDAGANTYSIEATVLAPNSCHFSGGAQIGIPVGMSVMPETQPVTLLVHRRPGYCALLILPILFRLQEIPLTRGKTHVTAFTVVDGTVMGAATKKIPTETQFVSMVLDGVSQEREDSGIVIESVSGWINAMPGTGTSPTVYVALTMSAPGLGYQCTLSDEGVGGETGRTLLLRLKCTKSAENALDRFSHSSSVNFSRSVKDENELDSVAVEFEGKIYSDRLEIVR